MSLHIYKPDQGYYTRVISSVTIGTLALCGGAWLWDQLAIFGNAYIQASAALIFVGIFANLIYWIYGINQKMVEFFIQTEGEMKRVNWSTRREVFGSTWVVIIVSVSIAIILFVTDIFFSKIFQLIGVLRSTV